MNHDNVRNLPTRPVASGSEPPHDDGMDARIERLDRAVERIDADLTSIRVSVAGIDERLKHVATKAQLLGWGLAGAVVVVGALWKIIAILLEANNAALAAQIAKSLAH